MLLNDADIRKLCCAPTWHNGRPMIEPFSEGISGEGILSWGLCSAGYDLRLSREIWVLKNTHGEVVDPLGMKDEAYVKRIYDTFYADGPYFIISAQSYILGVSKEYIRIPNNIKARCEGKSSYARVGITVNVTPLEPGWEGKLTIEISNDGPTPVKVYLDQGICQLSFEKLTDVSEKDYKAKKGKYDKQMGVTLSK